MYVTRPLSVYRRDSEQLSKAPTESLHSGYLVFTDEASDAEETCCWGACREPRLKTLPFPQNNIIRVVFQIGLGDRARFQYDRVWFLPVLDQPLCSNRYYVIETIGEHRGNTYRCSKREYGKADSTAFDHKDIYQQVEIIPLRHGFYARCVAPDGLPPYILWRKGWKVEKSSIVTTLPTDAHGLDISLRTQLPNFDFYISDKCSNTVHVGKWYCPFIFIREDENFKDPMKNSSFYEMTLDQRWEEIYKCECENVGERNNIVDVDVSLQTEVNLLYGVEAVKHDTYGLDEIIWYGNADTKGVILSLGLKLVIVEKMRLVQDMGGWVGGETRDVKVKRVEEYKGEIGWKRFACFVLVERFSLRRMDGTLLLTSDFRHINQVRCKWE